MAFPSDIEIAQNAAIKPIKTIAESIGLKEDDLDFYGKFKAKLPLELIDENKWKKNKLILVTAISPTPAGEGKTTTTVGLVDGLNKIGKKAIAALREPSLGPVFGIKGGAAGGGYAQVIPMEDINLHFTGDFSAVEKANNLLAALIDNELQSKEKKLNLDPKNILWKRVMDMNDRALRNIIIGVGVKLNGTMREDGFNITPASEVMAILCMSENLADLKSRLGNILIGFTYDNKPVYAKELNAENAMCILLKEAIKPNLVQTLEGNPAILHGGPFANIAQGTNTIIATKTALSLAEYTVTEAGFGADLGAEKFLHLKCLNSGLKPSAVVLVATIRALRHHGGAQKEDYNKVDLEKVKKGFENLKRHIENLKKFGYHSVVAINAFPNDSSEEINFVIESCKQMQINAQVARGFTEGGEGMQQLAHAVVEACENTNNSYRTLYKTSDSIVEKIETLAREVYRADAVEYSSKAKVGLRKIANLGIENLPVCMAKTQKSFSDDETKICAPNNFTITVREFEFALGAGFIIPILGDMMRMPGLPATPASTNMHIDNEGKISGLS